MKLGPILTLVVAAGVVAAAGCTGILDLESYKAGDAGDTGTATGDTGGACSADSCLACLLGKCSGAATCFGSGAIKGDFTGSLCPNYGACLCKCLDSTCAAACAAQKSADVACGGCLDTAIGPSECPAVADCASKCGS